MVCGPRLKATPWLPQVLTSILVTLSTFNPALGAQQPHPPEPAFDEEYWQALVASPSDVTFTINFADGKTQFMQGEIIRLELSYSSTTPDHYHVSFEGEGRIPGWETEIPYHLDPSDGVADPLDQYLHCAVTGWAFSILSSSATLEEKPVERRADLNEWFRFNKPGRYSIYAVTPTSKGTPNGQASPIRLTSNLLEFDVLPQDAGWAAQQVVQAAQVLDSPGNTEEHQKACQALRFLGTKAAAAEMIRRLDGSNPGCEYGYIYGLWGSPERTFVLTTMSAAFGRADAPVLLSFLQNFSRLSFCSLPVGSSSGKPPAAGSGDKDPERQIASEAEIERASLKRLIASLPQKRGRALGVCLGTLVEYYSMYPALEHTSPIRPFLKAIASRVAEAFSQIPPDEQYSLLDGRWEAIASPAMLPALHQLYENPPQIQSGQPVRDLALRRIYQLAPDAGREMILDEIRSSHPRVGIQVLGVLPDKTLPDLDDTLATNLESSKVMNDGYFDIHSALVSRYATASILSRVKAVYEHPGGEGALDIGQPMLEYFMRVDPAYGAELMKKNAEAPCKSASGHDCGWNTLLAMAQKHMGPDVHRIALDELENPEAGIAADAVRTLGNYGDLSDTRLLWGRLEEWNRTWAGRESELPHQFGGSTENAWEVRLETALVDAIAKGHAWTVDAEDLDRLEDLCVSRYCHEHLAEIRRDRIAALIQIIPMGEDALRAAVAQYDAEPIPRAKEKLAEYPAGTVFDLPECQGCTDEIKSVYLDLKSFLESHGLKIGKPPSR